MKYLKISQKNSITDKEYGPELKLKLSNSCVSQCSFCENRDFVTECSDKDYVNATRSLLHSYRFPISICGGEFGTSSKLPLILQTIYSENKQVGLIKMNGTSLYKLSLDGKTYIEELAAVGFKGVLELKRPHFRETINTELVKCLNVPANNDLIKIDTFCVDHGISMNLDCTLQKGGIENLKDLLNYLYVYDTIQMRNITFTEMPNESAEAFVSLSDIMTDLKSFSTFVPFDINDNQFVHVEKYYFGEFVFEFIQEKKNRFITLMPDSTIIV